MKLPKDRLDQSILSALSCYLHVDIIPEDVGPEWIREQAEFVASNVSSSQSDLEAVSKDLKRLAEGRDKALLYQTESATFCWVDEPEYFDVFIDIFKEMLSAVEYRIEWNRKNTAS